MKPKISVVIVTFNSEKVLEDAIQSFINQDYENKELVIIDGKSADGTVGIIKKYAENIGFWSSESDKGIYDAMNKGWKKASGEYILYLGSDDRLLNGGLSALGNNANEADIVYGDVKCMHPNGIVKTRLADNPKIIRKRPFCSHQSLMMKKNLFEHYGGFNCEYKILADFDLIQRACMGGASLQYVNYYISLFNMGGVSAFTFKSDKDKLKIYVNNRSLKYPYLVFAKNVIIKTLIIVKHKIYGK